MGLPRWLIVTVVAVAVIVAGAGLALPYLIDVNTYRGLIQTKAEETIGRKVTLGQMSLRVFPGLGIEVRDPAVEGLLKARSLTVGVRLLPLVFSRTIDLKKVVLDGAEITVAKAADGTWNFETPAAPSGVPPAEPTQPEAPRPFSLSSLVIKDCTAHLVHEAGRGAAVATTDVRMDMTASAERSAAGDVKASFDGALASTGVEVDVSGTVEKSGERTSFDVLLDRAQIEIARVRELAPLWGGAWPLPDGLLLSKEMTFGGRVAATLTGGRPSTIALTDVVLRGAQIGLSRDRRGRWNFESIMGEQKAPPGGTAAPAPATDVTVKNLRLADIEVALRDEAAGDGRTVDLKLSDLQLVVEELSRDRPLRIDLQARVQPGAGTLKIGGSFPWSSAPGGQSAVDGEIELESVDIAPVAPYLKSLMGLSAETGAVTLKGNVKGTYPQSLRANGSLSLQKVKITSLPRPVTAAAEFDITAADAAARLQIARVKATAGGSEVTLRGSLDRSGGASMADLEVPPAQVQAADLLDLLALAGKEIPLQMSSPDPVRLQARIKGDLSGKGDLDLSGSLEVSSFTFHHPRMTQPMEQVRGKVAFKRNGLDVTGFSGMLGKSDIAGNLSVAGFDEPRVTFTLTSRHAEFWELMSFMKEEPAAPPRDAGTGASAPAGDPLDRVTANGDLSIGEGSFGALAFTDLRSTLSLKDKVIRLDPVSMKLYSGGMNGAATMDMRANPPIYTVSARAAGIDSNALLGAGMGLRDMLSGAMTGDLQVTASGASQQAVLKNARGGGEIRLEKGRVGAVNVLKALSRASDLLGEKSLKEVSSRLASEGTDFTSLAARLTVASGSIRAESLSLISPDLELGGDGDLDMLAGKIRVAGTILFSEALSQAMVDEKSRAVDFFWDTKRGRVSVPLTLSGPIAAPTPNIDWGSAGGKLARRKAEETLRDRLKGTGLGGLLGGKLPESKPGSSSPLEGSAPAPSPPAAGELGITIDEQGFSGNLLMPDLRVRGTLRGTEITRAGARVTDGSGRVVYEGSLMEKVTKFYTTHDRSQPATIGFKVEVDGKKLATVRGDLTIELTVQDAAGKTATKSAKVSRR